MDFMAVIASVGLSYGFRREYLGAGENPASRTQETHLSAPLPLADLV